MEKVKYYDYELEFFNGNDKVLQFKSWGTSKHNAIQFAIRWMNTCGNNMPIYDKVEVTKQIEKGVNYDTKRD